MSALDKLSAKVTLYELSRTFRAGQGANQQESKTLFKSMLTQAGSDLNRFEELKKLNAAELADWIARVAAESAEQSSVRQVAVNRSVENWMKGLEYRQAASPSLVVEAADTANSITGITFGPDGGPGQINLISSNIAPFNNSAKVSIGFNHFNTFDSDFDTFRTDSEVTFSFSWQNSTGQSKNINVDGLLGINAGGGVEGGSWIIPPIPKADLVVNAVMEIRGLWTDPPFQPPMQSDQSQSVLDLHVEGEWWDIYGGKIQDVSQLYDLQHTMLSVPPGGIIVVDIKCQVTEQVHSESSVSFDANRGDRQLTAYGVWIGILP